jgi:hypothetical protein
MLTARWRQTGEGAFTARTATARLPLFNGPEWDRRGPAAAGREFSPIGKPSLSHHNSTSNGISGRATARAVFGERDAPSEHLIWTAIDGRAEME